MTLNDLVNKYHSTHQKWEQHHKKAEAESEKTNSAVFEIYDCVKKEFGTFVNELNSKLSNEQKVTRWKTEDPHVCGGGVIYYNGTPSNLRVSIQIEEIGGKICRGSIDKYDLPIPSFLDIHIQEFINQYNIPISICIRNPDWDSECDK